MNNRKNDPNNEKLSNYFSIRFIHCNTVARYVSTKEKLQIELQKQP